MVCRKKLRYCGPKFEYSIDEDAANAFMYAVY